MDILSSLLCKKYIYSILICALFLFISFKCRDFEIFFKKNQSFVKVVNVVGKVDYFNLTKIDLSGNFLKNNFLLLEGKTINVSDTIITGLNSSALIEINNVHNVRIQPNSIIKLNTLKDKSELFVIRGSVQSSFKSELFRNKKNYSIKYNHIPLTQRLEINLNENEINLNKSSMNLSLFQEKYIRNISDNSLLKKSEKLLNPYIENHINNMIKTRLNNQKKRIYRCYSNILQKDNNSNGKISLSFILKETGKVESISISSSDFKEEGFHKCLKDIIVRTNFLPFKGSNITAYLPLKFQKKDF